MYEQMVPPAPVDRIRDGLPNLRHGTVGMHPLEVHLKELANTENKTEYQTTSALFGIGFANELKTMQKIVDGNNLMFNGCDLGHDLVTGEIDDIDFGDIFQPTQQRVEIDYNPHIELEKRVFGDVLKVDI
ncbi:hypothetical protein TRFO_03059 [Tritrichomonas foetus]|uniref:Uncharacterized protein n=1 Tax=Tritrichomonas foetus TaxID=1144522 RepID=A0A1J4KYW5_9EUKA|nr:hypothetical protein TRFO_03059 [Tritrichomonas foetus]|eukprot:OHT14773.1 hypothetical protein TRFO_03059 [Tritrichomonas foetus]